MSIRALTPRSIDKAALEVRAEGPPSLTSFRLGAKVRWRTITDPYLTDAWNEQTLIQFSGSLKPKVNLALSEFWVGM